MPFTVMIVEDDPSTRRLYRFLLANSGYIVVEAEDGRSALEHFSRQPCDIIITDLNMPRMDGLDLVRAIRAQSTETYIIMVTAFGTLDVEKEAFKVGINEYFTKPFDFDEIVRSIKLLFERRSSATPG